ncbi:MAG: hypothetical protein LIP04_12390 [Tannerellaceae bacterium]|nr:hypothetical protein [Tannerellaceae bacterium]
MKLKKVTLEKYEGKIANKETYSLFGVQKSFLLGAKVLEKTEYQRKSTAQQQTIKEFIKSYANSDPQLFTEISKIISE